MGAAVTSIISEIVFALVFILLSHKYFRLNLKLLKETVIKVGISLTIMTLILLWMKVLNNSSFIFSVFEIFIAVVSYFGMLIITREPIVDLYYSKLKRKEKKQV